MGRGNPAAGMGLMLFCTGVYGVFLVLKSDLYKLKRMVGCRNLTVCYSLVALAVLGGAAILWFFLPSEYAGFMKFIDDLEKVRA